MTSPGPSEESGLRTRTRYADGTGETYVLDGHLVPAQRRMPLPVETARGHDLTVIGRVENYTGWVITVATSADGSVRLDDGGRWGVIDLAITDPDGHTEHLVRFARNGYIAGVPAVRAAENGPVELHHLFLASVALDFPGYQERLCAPAWALAQKAHAWSRDITTPPPPPTDPTHAVLPAHVPWVHRPEILNWLACPTKAEAARWASRLGHQHDAATAFVRDGWSLDDSAPWIEHAITHQVAHALREHGWTPYQGACLRRAVVRHADYGDWLVLGAAEAWLPIGTDKSLTALAALAALTPEEARGVTDADRPGLLALAAFHTAPDDGIDLTTLAS